MRSNGKFYRFTVLLFATGAGAGFSPIASGTVGTLLPGIPIYLLLSGLPSFLYIIILLLLTAFAIYLCEAADRILGEKDSSKIVIDEIAGFLVTMAFIPLSVYTIIAGFLLFRFFDITKLQPAKWIEDNLSGGMGVALDDVMAGIYANMSLHLLIWIADITGVVIR